MKAAPLLAALLVLPGSFTLARAQAWSGEGAPVCTAPGSQSRTQVLSDGAGGAFVAWSDQRPGAFATDIYLTRIGPDGAPVQGWPTDGMVVCAAAGVQLLYSLAPDGKGGLFLAWEDYRNGTLSDIYGHHILADGQLAPGWPADGLGISVFAEEQRDPRLDADHEGGVFCVWADARNNATSQRDIYAQHLRGDGSLPMWWAANGMPVTRASTYDYGARGVAASNGGLHVTWTRGLAGQNIGAQHLNPTGVPATTWPDTGIVLCGAPLDQSGAAVISGASGRAMAVWKDLRNYSGGNTESNFFAVRYGPDTNRVASWPRDGVQLYASTNGISAPFVVGDGSGGLHLLWGELVSGTDEDLFTMHLDSIGGVVVSIPFPDGVVPVCPHPSFQHPISIAPDGAGGVFIGWGDFRADPSFVNSDPYVQHITAGARIAPGWPATGVALSTDTAPEGETMVAAVTGGVIAVWSRGSGANTDLFASFVGLDGVVDVLVSLVSTEASPGRVRIVWEVAESAEWQIERSEDALSWREIARGLPDGQGRVSVTDASVFAGGRYGYRLASAAGGGALGETWIDVPRSATRFALHGTWPNPLTSDARVRFAVPEPGEATLTLLDPLGRPLREWNTGRGGGERQLVLTGLRSLAPGIYWLRLRQGARVAATRIAIVR